MTELETRRMTGKFAKKIGALLLSLAFLATAPQAGAEERVQPWESAGILDEAALTALVEGYIEEKGLKSENIGVGYCYTATGDSWYYNGERWFYSASMYKVPLMMLLAEKEYEGELSQDSLVKGLPLSQAEEYVLVNSNNDYAHLMMSYFGTDRECRELYQQYSDLPKEDYDPDFYDYSYFCPRFMTDVVETLYFDSERFPNIIDCLKRAQPDNYFNLRLGSKYEIAQKYGSYKEFNSACGIIYTPNPFVLTVMTENLSIAMGEMVTADIAVLMEEYTLSLDAELERFRQEQEALQAKAEEEERQRLEEEQKALREEQERRDREEQERREKQEQAAREAEKKAALIKIAGAAGVIVLAAGAIAALLLAGRRRKKRPVSKGGARRGAGSYTPRH